MPTIEPIFPAGTITLNHNTQLPSVKQAQRLQEQTQTPSEPSTQTPQNLSERKEEPKDEEHEKKLRPLIEKEKKLFFESKRIEKERRQLELEKAQTRQWLEAAELSKTNKLEALNKLGISYEDLTTQILNNGEIPPAQIARQTAEQIANERVEAYKKEQQEQSLAQQQKMHQEGMQRLEADVRDAAERSENFPLVKHEECYQDITKWIESEFHRTGKLISVEDALERWEQRILQRFEGFAQIDKVRSYFTSKDTPRPTQAQIPHTLSQRATAPTPAPKPMTASERRQRAIDAFYGRST